MGIENSAKIEASKQLHITTHQNTTTTISEAKPSTTTQNTTTNQNKQNIPSHKFINEPLPNLQNDPLRNNHLSLPDPLGHRPLPLHHPPLLLLLLRLLPAHRAPPTHQPPNSTASRAHHSTFLATALYAFREVSHCVV